MGIGLGLIAADSYFKEGDRRREREKNEERFGWERERQEDWAATAPALREARISSAQLQHANNGIGLSTVEQRSKNAQQQAAYDGATLTLNASELEHQKGLQADRFAKERNDAKLAKEVSKAELDDWAKELIRKRQTGVVSDAQTGIDAMAKFHDVYKVNGTAGVASLMNQMNECLPDGKRSPRIASLEIVQDPQYGNVFVAKGADGQVITQWPESAMLEAKSLRSEGKATKAGPLERDVDYLVRSHGMTHEQALRHLNSAKTKSEDQFVMELVKERMTLTGSVPSEKEVEGLHTLYRSITSQAGHSQPVLGLGQARPPTQTPGTEPTPQKVAALQDVISDKPTLREQWMQEDMQKYAAQVRRREAEKRANEARRGQMTHGAPNRLGL